MKNTTISKRGISVTRPKKVNKYIEIVGSNNPRLNAMSKGSQLAVEAVLRGQYTKVAITIVNDMVDLENLVAKKPDLVVLGMSFVLLDPLKGYDESPKVWLSDYLTQHDINFTGSGTDALYSEYNKHEAKQMVIDAGLQSSAYFISTVSQPSFEHNLKFPLFVKPTNRCASVGIDEKSVVESDTDLRLKIISIHNDFSSDAIIEEYLPGREFSVAIIKQSNSDDYLTMPIEITVPIDARGNRFLSKKVKKADTEEVLAVDDSIVKDALNTLAIGVFKALGSRDYGRIDLRLDGDGLPSFLEANLMPGLSDHGYLSKCFYMNEQILYHDMILAIVELGLERNLASQENLVQVGFLNDPNDSMATEFANILPTA